MVSVSIFCGQYIPAIRRDRRFFQYTVKFRTCKGGLPMRTAAFLPDGDAWSAIFGILLNGARDRYRQTVEYRHCLERRRQLDNDLTYGLLDEQKEMVDEALLELDATAEEESRFLYQQGLADGVRLLGIMVGPA